MEKLITSSVILYFPPPNTHTRTHTYTQSHSMFCYLVFTFLFWENNWWRWRGWWTWRNWWICLTHWFIFDYDQWWPCVSWYPPCCLQCHWWKTFIIHIWNITYNRLYWIVGVTINQSRNKKFIHKIGLIVKHMKFLKDRFAEARICVCWSCHSTVCLTIFWQ